MCSCCTRCRRPGSQALAVATMFANTGTRMGKFDNTHLIGGSRHGRFVVAARVGVAGISNAKRLRCGIHPDGQTGPPSRRPIAPAPRAKRALPTAAAKPASGCCWVSRPPRRRWTRPTPARPRRRSVSGTVGFRERDGLGPSSPRSLWRGHGGGDAPSSPSQRWQHASCVLVRAGLDLRPSCSDERRLTLCRPHRAWHRFAGRAVPRRSESIGDLAVEGDDEA